MSNQPFFTMLRNAHLYAPEDQGIQDLLIAGDKIAGIGKGIEAPKGIECREIDLKGARVLPGFIDGHVHMIGGGGEGGYHTRTYIYTGAYELPTPTITGSVRKDIVMIDKSSGAGEIAMSDHRSGQPTAQDYRRLAAETRVGGMISGKAGIINMHMGDGRNGMKYLFEITEDGEIPKQSRKSSSRCRCSSFPYHHELRRQRQHAGVR